MKGKIFTIACWAFYVALMYTAFNPEHAYLNALDNARTLYLVIHIPLTILMGIFTLLLVVGKKALDKTILEAKDKLLEDPEQVKKFVDEFEKLNKFNLFMILNRLFYYPAALIVFIKMNDNLLGVTMIIGIFLGLYLMDQIKYIAKELRNAIN